jgi:hypothetical protein
VGIQPLLTFDSRSPDGFLVLLAKPEDRTTPWRALLNAAAAQDRLQLNYADLNRSQLSIESSQAPRQVSLDARSQLPRTIWSHLNTFTELTVVGHKRLFLSFSPNDEVRIEVKPMEYPVGAPARFAYVDAQLNFRVVEARSAEKGPFKTLLAGPTADPALRITLYDEDMPIARLTFHDWLSQVSTNLSPTAGWGVPENAIEFSLQGREPSSMASIFLTLAATSVGRGYDAVGHAPGIYRNRLDVEWLIDPSTSAPSP